MNKPLGTPVINSLAQQFAAAIRFQQRVEQYSALVAASVDQYARKQSQSPELFDDAGQARWITIGSEAGADGKKHGGHPVKIDSQGKMLTGAFAGQTMGQAFGKKSQSEKPDANQTQTRRDQDDSEGREIISGSKVGDKSDDANKMRAYAKNLAAQGRYWKFTRWFEGESWADEIMHKFGMKEKEKEKPQFSIPDGMGRDEFVRQANFRMAGDTTYVSIKGSGELMFPGTRSKEKILDALFKPPAIQSDTRANESAKTGDQMGLFGDVANVPKGKAKLDQVGETKGQQMAMFDTKGDPDQMLMFDDGVTPEDRLMPEAKTPKPFEPTLLGKTSPTKQMTNEQVEQMQEHGFEGEPDDQSHPGHAERKSAQARVAEKRAARMAAPVDAKSVVDEIGKTFEQSAKKPEQDAGGEEPKKDDNGRDFAPGVSYSTIPLSAGIAAHRGTSFAPEKRGAQRQKDFAHSMNEAYEDLKQSAKVDDQKIKQLDEQWPRFVQSAKSKYMDALHADSRTMSAMIAGPANFPTNSNRKKLDSAMNKWSEYSDFVDRATKAIRRDLHPENAPKKIGDKDTGSHLETKVANLQKRQDQMKSANAIVRKYIDFNKTGRWSGDVFYKDGKSPEGLSQELQEKVGLSEKEANALTKRDPYGNHVGFAPYELTNNNANLKRYKDQLERQKKFEAEAKVAESSGEKSTEHAFDGGKVHLDYEDNRIRIAHDSKPSAEVIAKLKSKGFRWSPANKAWQRQLTNAAKYDVHALTGVPLEKLTPKQDDDKEQYAFTPVLIDRYIAKKKVRFGG